jgi:hypothetical protein
MSSDTGNLASLAKNYEWSSAEERLLAPTPEIVANLCARKRLIQLRAEHCRGSAGRLFVGRDVTDRTVQAPTVGV